MYNKTGAFCYIFTFHKYMVNARLSLHLIAFRSFSHFLGRQITDIHIVLKNVTEDISVLTFPYLAKSF